MAGDRQPVHAQILTSFLDAATSPVRYSEAKAKPEIECRRLLSLTSFDFAVISAREMTGHDTVGAHCRVVGHIAPQIRFQVNLPTAWNERLYMIGNGGFAGAHPDSSAFLRWQERGVANGFISVYMDTGHDASVEPGSSFADGNLSKEVDFGFRSLKVTADVAKLIAERYYGRPPRRSYFDGCSTGGRQAFVIAQRFPDAFDGIVAGAPPFDATGFFLLSHHAVSALEKIEMTRERLAVLGEAVYRECDGVDGLTDGVIEDPRRCPFDPVEDLPACERDAPGKSCFTRSQREALADLYGPLRAGGSELHPGVPFGAEPLGQPPAGSSPTGLVSGWEPRLWAPTPATGADTRTLLEQRVDDWITFLAFEDDDAERTWRDFDLDRDLDRVGLSTAILSALDTDLAPLAEAGGRLIVYHGWADAGPSPQRTAEYFEALQEEMGMTAAHGTARLFMVPGMFHCSGGVNVDRIDAMTALINWVEEGVAPSELLARREEGGKVVRARPICAYPQVARYTGEGSTEEAANFRCVSRE